MWDYLKSIALPVIDPCFIVICDGYIIMMTSSNGSIVRVTGPLCGEFTDHWWIPHKKASDAEILYFHSSVRE